MATEDRIWESDDLSVTIEKHSRFRYYVIDYAQGDEMRLHGPFWFEWRAREVAKGIGEKRP